MLDHTRPGPEAGAVRLLDVPRHLWASAEALGAAWDRGLRAHVHRGASLPPALAPFASAPHSLERLCEAEIRGTPEPATPPRGDVALRPHQVVAAAAIAAARDEGRPGFVLADDVGLGKTLSIVGAVLDMYDVDTVLVVCPLYAVAHWRASIAMLGDCGKRFVVINYDRLKRLVDVPDVVGPARGGRRRKVSSLRGVARFGRAHAYDVVVWDECQRLRNPESARSLLAAKLTAASGFAVWASATTGHGPLELSYLAPVLRWRLAAPGTSDHASWCRAAGMSVSKGRGGKASWFGHEDSDAGRDAKARDLATMRRLVFEGPRAVGLRRTPEDIAGWPPITRSMSPVRLSEEAAEAYELAWHVFRDQLRLAGGRRASRPHVLTEQLRFRQKASLLRVGATAELVRDLLDAGRQVAVSVAFHETLDALRDALGGDARVAEVHGRRTPGENEASRMDFQTGRATVVLYTPVDAISLHEGEHNDAPRANVVHDVRWSGIDMRQVEGRCHRDGRSCPTYWLVADGTIDVRVAQAVVGRIEAMASMHGDDDAVDALHAMLAFL